MKSRMLVLAFVATIAAAPAAVRADHDPSHDTRYNPNCAWDSKRSADYDGDGEPDHMIIGVAHNTTFPRQIINIIEPLTGIDQIPPFFGAHDGPDNASVVVQGDHRMLGANPAHDEEGETNDPEQKHNGAIYANVDYDDIEYGRAPKAAAGAGIYEANHLTMACVGTEQDPEAAVCLSGREFYRLTDEPCPQD